MNCLPVVQVKFREEAKIPGLEVTRGGLSLRRAKGGNEEKVLNRITYDAVLRMLVLEYRRPGYSPVMVPLENVAWFEIMSEAQRDAMGELEAVPKFLIAPEDIDGAEREREPPHAPPAETPPQGPPAADPAAPTLHAAATEAPPPAEPPAKGGKRKAGVVAAGGVNVLVGEPDDD